MKIKYLCECGLVVDEPVRTDFVSFLDSQHPVSPFEFSGKVWLLHDEKQQFSPQKPLFIHGYAFTAVGQELMLLVDREQIDEFAQEVEQGLRGLGVKLVELSPEMKRQYDQRTGN